MGAPRTQRLMGTNTWLTDMDGVLVREEAMIPGAARLLQLWRERGQRFLVLTNNSMYTPRDLSARLARSGLQVRESELWTSALATAEFLRDQSAGHRAYVIGEAGLTTAMHEAGFVLTDTDCDYVVLGETRTYSFEAITKAIRLIDGGARFIATNPDTTGPSPEGPLPATGAVAAMISAATKTAKQPYVVGKPNPMMFRSALNRIGAHSETTAMLGDRMDTDIIAGMEAGLSTLLVLSGVTKREQVEQFPFRPTAVMESVQDLVNLLDQPGPDGSMDG
ncbi:HAD-IIA family hydrolase [Kocuria sp. ZOR0020]|nr:HAD-IIA family hydrolase [Kocuria sp. ZOR0020]